MLFPHYQMKMLHVFFCQGNRPVYCLPAPSLDTESQSCETVFLQIVQMLYPVLVPPFPETPLTWSGPGTTWFLLFLDLLLEQEQHLLHHGGYCTTCWIQSSRMEQISLFSPFLKEASKEHPGRQRGGHPLLATPSARSWPIWSPGQAGTLQDNTVLMKW